MIAARAFEDHLGADLVRLSLIFMGAFLVMLAVRVAWLRWKAPVGDRLKDSSPFALLSYALFAAIPTVEALYQFGEPVNWPRTIAYSLALACGVIAAFGQVTYSKWRRAPAGRHREVRESEPA